MGPLCHLAEFGSRTKRLDQIPIWSLIRFELMRVSDDSTLLGNSESSDGSGRGGAFPAPATVVLGYPSASSKSLSVARSLFICRLPAASKSGPVNLTKVPGSASTLWLKRVPSSVGSKT